MGIIYNLSWIDDWQITSSSYGSFRVMDELKKKVKSLSLFKIKGALL